MLFKLQKCFNPKQLSKRFFARYLIDKELLKILAGISLLTTLASH